MLGSKWSIVNCLGTAPNRHASYPYLQARRLNGGAAAS
jgi:hypothetical protein